MPPPPPPAPPPLPFLSGNKNAKTDFKPAPNRNVLLSQIRKGAHLRNVETNDRSSPLIEGSGKKTASGGSVTNACKSNGPSPLIPPGGLFAQGMPKLRSTTAKGGDGLVRPFAASHNNAQNETNFSFDKTAGALHPAETGGSRSQPPSPAAKLRQQQSVHRSLTDAASCRNFPSDVSVKGPAPAPPPANQKPNFNSDFCARNKQASVRRSSSQTSLGPKVRPARPPPNIRPPPPPKSSSALNSAPPPPPPSKPPNVMRRQSFGVSDTTFMMNYNGSRFSAKLSVPPPPPRNNSAPNSLNNSQNSPVSTHVNKMMTAPPPPPSRPAIGNVRTPVVRPPPPPIRAPAPPPPPPPHRFTAHPTPQVKSTHLTNSVVPPPPPTRISSATSNVQPSDSVTSFESRFMHKFSGMRNFPAPDRFTNMRKVYSSRMPREKSVRRQPPPPPPTVNGGTTAFRGGPPSHQPVLHIQLDSRIFANNTAHC